MKKNKYLIFLVIFIAIAFVSVSFAAFNTRLYINGSGMLRAQAEIRINGIENNGYYGGGIENYNPNYDVDKTNASVDLPTSNSRVEYEVTIKNYGERAFMPEITLLSDVGPNVIITISDGVHTYNLPDDDMEYEFAANEEKTFIITISNKPGTTNNDVVVSLDYTFLHDEVTAPIIELTQDRSKVQLLQAGTSTFSVDHYEYYVSTSTTAPTENTTASGTTTDKVNTSSINQGHFYIWYRTVSSKNTKSDWSNRVEVTKEFTLTYNCEYTCNPASVTADYNTAWGTLCAPTKTGNTFVGWYTQPNGNGTQITSSSKALSNITVYCYFEVNRYTVTLNGNNGTFSLGEGVTGWTLSDSNTKATKQVYYNNPIANLPTASRNGYTFVEYNTQANGNGTEVTSETIMGTSAITGYAIWHDSTKPVCTWASAPTLIYGSTATVELTCTDNDSMNSQSLNASDFTTSNSSIVTVSNVSSPVQVTGGYKYTVTLNGNGTGEYTVGLKAATIEDAAGNKNEVSSLNGSVSQKEITASINTCTEREYNGQTGVICTLSLTGLESGDAVTASGTCSASDAAVANNKTVTCTNITLSGNDSGEYSLSSTTATKTNAVNITKKTVTVSFDTCTAKTYDGNTDATCTFTVNGLVGSEAASANATCNYDDADAKENKTITCTSFTLTGTNKDNYNSSTTTLTMSTGTINKKDVSVSWGSTTTFTYNGNPQAPTASVTTGVTGETMTVTRTQETNASENAYTSTASCDSVSGGRAKCSNYNLTNKTKSYTIGKATLSVTAMPYNNTYDGSVHYATIKVTSSGWTGKIIVSGETSSYGESVTTNGSANTDYNLKPGYTNYTNGAKTIYYKVTGGNNYNDATGSTTVTIAKETCNPPTNVAISSTGVVTWTASSNATGYQISIDNSNFTTATSGINYRNTIIAAAGSRTVYVRSVCDSTNYTTPSANATQSVNVYTVTLAKGTGISEVSGAGNYISGETVNIDATTSSGYNWSKWTQTTGGSQVSTNKSYSSEITSNWSYTANAVLNKVTLTIKKDGSNCTDCSGYTVGISTSSEGDFCKWQEITTSSSTLVIDGTMEAGTTYYVWVGEDSNHKSTKKYSGVSFTGGSAATATINFYTITASLNNTAMTFNGTSVSNNGTVVALGSSSAIHSIAATAGNGYTFSSWSSSSTSSTVTSTSTASTTFKAGAATTLTATSTDVTNPECTISRSDYNTFSWTASDTVGITGYAITNSDTAPTSWTTTGTLTSGTYDVSSANTWYIWAKDAAGNKCHQSITSYSVSRSTSNCSLTTKYDTSTSSGGTSFTSTTVMLSGTPIYATSSASTGYNNVTLKHGDTNISNNTYNVGATEAINCSATINKVTLTIKKDGSNCTDCSGYVVHISGSDTTDSISWNGTTTASSSLVINGAMAAGTTYYVWVGEDSNHKNTMKYSGVSFTGGSAATAIINFYTVTASLNNTAMTFNGTSVSNNGTVVALGSSSATHSIAATAGNGYTFSSWSSSSTSSTVTSTSTASTTFKAGAATTLTATSLDITPPTCTVSRTNYNTLHFSTNDIVGATHYAITNSDSEPTNWTSGANTGGGYFVDTAGTWYVWAKDAAGNVCTPATINAYTISRNQGTGTTLITRYDSTSSSTGTAFTNTKVMLEGTSIWASSTANDGYNTPTLEHGSTSMTASGSTFTVGATEAITSGATANTYTINYYQGNGTETAGTTLLGTSTCTYNASCTLRTYSNLGGTFPRSTNDWSFNGWSSTETGTAIAKTNGETFTYTTIGNTNLYAVGRRTFAFSSGNAPTTNSGAKYQFWNPYSTSTDYVTAVEVPSAASLSSYGWTFIGYRGNDNASSTVTIDPSHAGATTYKAEPDNLTTLHFRAIYSRTLSIAYNNNEGSGTTENQTKTQYYNSGYGNGSTNSGSNTSGVSFTLKSANTFTKTGYTLKKWTEDSTSGTEYDLGASFAWNPGVTASSTKTMYAKWADEENPECTISRSDYNTISWTASDTVGITGYAITNSDTAPTSWTTTGTLTSGTYDVSSANTWYIWAKDAAGNKCHQSITSYSISRSTSNCSLTTKYDTSTSSGGTSFTSTTVMLSGTPIYATSSASTGYNNVTLKHGDTNISNNTYNVGATEAINCSASAKTYTITLDKGTGTSDGTTSVTATYNSATISPSTISLAGKAYTISGFGTAASRNSDGASVSSTSTLTSTATISGYYTASSNGTKVLDANTTATWTASASGYTDANKKWIKDGTATLYAQFGNMSSKTLPTITKDGYTCGWTTSSTGTTITYASGGTLTPTGNTTLYGVCVANTVTVNLKLDGNAYSNSGLKVTLYNGATATTHTATISSGSSATLSGVPAGTYNVYAGKDANHKTDLVDSGVDVTVNNGTTTGGSASTTVNYFTLTITTSNTGVTVNGTSVANNGTVAVLGGTTTASSNYGHAIVGTGNTGYTFSAWSKTAGTATIASTSNASTTVKVAAASTINATSTGNTYTATFYYQSNITSGSSTISTLTSQCTVSNAEGNCNADIPADIRDNTVNMGTYNNAYYGLSTSVGNMNAAYDKNATSVTISANTSFYSLYSSAVTIYEPISDSAAEGSVEAKTYYRNQWFKSTSALETTKIATTPTGTANFTYTPNVSTYTSLYGFRTSANSTSYTYGTIAKLATSNSTTVYQIVRYSVTGTFYYNSNTTCDGSVTVSTATATGYRYLYCETTTKSKKYNGGYTVPTAVTESKGPYCQDYAFTATYNSTSSTKSSGYTKLYAVYRANITNYYYSSGYTTRTLYRNSYFKVSAPSTYSDMTTVLSTSNTGSANYSTAAGPGSSAWSGLSTEQDTTAEYSTVAAAADPKNNNVTAVAYTDLYTIYQFNVTYTAGNNVSSIGTSSGDGINSCKVTTSDTSCSVTLPSITASTGYNPAGWSTTNGDTNGTAAGGSYTLSTNNITLYANAAPKTYTITLDKGTGTSAGTTSVTATYNSAAISPSTITPASKSYTISGFSRASSRNSSNATISSTDTLTSTADLTGYFASTSKVLNPSSTASWVSNVSGYTDSNGKWIKDGTATLTAQFGDMSSVTLPTITKDGYTCGWTTSSTGTTIMYASGGTLTPTGNTTLYGVCVANTVTINLKLDGNAYSNSGLKVTLYNGATATTHTATISSGSSATLSGVPAGTYNVYAGKDANHKTDLVDSGVDVTVNNGTTTGGSATATVNYFTLTITTSNTGVTVNGTSVANNGTVAVLGGTTTASSNYGHAIVGTGNTGYTFSAWSKTAGTATIASTSNASTTVKVAATSTINATSAAKTYTISLNKGTCATDGTTSVTATYNSATISPSTITMAKTTYTISGFGTAASRNSDGATVSSTSNITSTVTTDGYYTTNGGSTKVLTGTTAAWVASVSEYTDANKKWIKDSTATVYAKCGSHSAKTLPTITKSGYTCGWTTSSTGTTITYASGGSLTPTGNTTLYGVCVANTVTINLKLDGNAYSNSEMQVTLYSGTTATTHTATISSGSSATLSGVPAGTYNVYAGKDANHKTSVVDSGVDVTVSNGTTTGGSATATVNYFTLTITTSNTGVTVNGTSVANNGTVAVLGGTTTASSNYGHAIVGTGNTGYTFSAWSKTAGTATIANTSNASTTVKVAAASTINATSAAKTYTITLNKGTGTSNGTASVTATYNSAAISPSTITLASKSYTVSGFTLLSSATNASVSSTDSLTSTADLTGYFASTSNVLKPSTTAEWFSSVSGYTDASGKWTKDGGVTLTAQFGNMSSVTLPTITKDGYVCGWTTNNNATTITYASGGTLTPTGNTTLYGVCVANKVTINLTKDGSAYSNSGIKVTLYDDTTATEHTATISSGSSATLSGVPAGTYNLYAGIDENHKTTLGDSGVDVTITPGTTSGANSTVSISYFTLTVTTSNTGVTVNGSSVANNGTVVVLAGTTTPSRNYSHAVVGTGNTGYTFSAWSKTSGTATFASTSNASTTVQVAATSTINATSTGNTYTATFYYQSDTTSGSSAISTLTSQCTVSNTEGNCNADIPADIRDNTVNMGTYNNEYYGLSASLNNMTVAYDKNATSVTISANTPFYSLYSSEVEIYEPISDSMAEGSVEKKIYHRNQWFKSTSALETTKIATTPTGTANFTYTPNVSTYTSLYGFRTSANSTTRTYSSVAGLAASNSTTVYQIVRYSVTGTFYYNSNTTCDGSVTVSTATATGYRYLYCETTTKSKKSNSNYSVPTAVTESKGPYCQDYVFTATYDSMTSTKSAAYLKLYAVYRASITNYYYSSSYTTRTLYRNSYFKVSAPSSYSDMTTVLSTSATGKTNYSTAVGPGSSVWSGLSTEQDTTAEYSTVAAAADPKNNSVTAVAYTNLYTVYQFNATLSKGANVSSIGTSTGDGINRCKVTTSETGCPITLPSITANSGYHSVGWSTTNGDTTGTAAGSSYTLSSNNTTLYANAVSNTVALTIKKDGSNCTSCSGYKVYVSNNNASNSKLCSFTTTGDSTKTFDCAVIPGDTYYIWAGIDSNHTTVDTDMKYTGVSFTGATAVTATINYYTITGKLNNATMTFNGVNLAHNGTVVALGTTNQVHVIAATANQGYAFSSWASSSSSSTIASTTTTPTTFKAGAATNLTVNTSYNATVSISRTSSDTFSYSANGATGYYVSTTNTTPSAGTTQSTFALNTWTSATSTNNLTLTAGTTYYVWAEDSASGTVVGPATIAVRTVTLTKGTGVDSVSGAGNYLQGTTVSIDATCRAGYSWSKWTQTSGGTQVTTTKAYSAAIGSSNWSYTSNCTANNYTVVADATNCGTINSTTGWSLVTTLYDYQEMNCVDNGNGTYSAVAGSLVEGSYMCPPAYTVCDADHIGTYRQGACVSSTINSSSATYATKTVTFDSTYGTLPNVNLREGYGGLEWKSGDNTITSSTTVNTPSNHIIVANCHDTTSPTCTLSSTTDSKTGTQTITATFSDVGTGVEGWYLGSSSTPQYNSIDATSSFERSITASSAGTYYCYVKDGSVPNPNVGDSQVEMCSYTVKNMLVNITGTETTYSTNHYTQASSETYIIPKGTTLTLADIYTTPNGALTSTYKGYSIGAPSATATTISTNSTYTLNTCNTTITAWFGRKSCYFKATAISTCPTVKLQSSNNTTGVTATTSSNNKTMTVRYGESLTATGTPGTGLTWTGWTGILAGQSNPTNPPIVIDDTNCNTNSSTPTIIKPEPCVDATDPICILQATSSNIEFKSSSDNVAVTGWYISDDLNDRPANGESNLWKSSAASAKLSIAVGTYYGWVKDAAGNIGSCTYAPIPNGKIIDISTKNGVYTCTKTANPLYNCTHAATPTYTCQKAATVASSSNVTCNTKAKHDSPSTQCASGYTYAGNNCSVSYSCPNGGTLSGTVCQYNPTTKYLCYNNATANNNTNGCTSSTLSQSGAASYCSGLGYPYVTENTCAVGTTTYSGTCRCGGNVGGSLVYFDLNVTNNSSNNCNTICKANYCGACAAYYTTGSGTLTGTTSYTGHVTCTRYTCSSGELNGTQCRDYTQRTSCSGWAGYWSAPKTCPNGGSYNSDSKKCEYAATATYSGTINCNTYSCTTGEVTGTNCVTSDNVGSCSSGWTANPTTATGYNCSINYSGSTLSGSNCIKNNQTATISGWTCNTNGSYTCLDGGTLSGSTCILSNQSSALSGWTCNNLGANCSTGAVVGDYCYNHIEGVTLDKQGGSGSTPSVIYYAQGTATANNKYYTNPEFSGTAITSVAVPTRTGYTFGGFYSGTNGTGTQYINASGTIINNLYQKNPTTDINNVSTLYAKWTGDPIAVNYEENLFVNEDNTANGVTVTYDASNQYITLNGTWSSTARTLGNLLNTSVTDGETYRITLEYISGSYTSTVTPYFSLEFQVDGVNYSPRTNGTHYRTIQLPTSGTSTATLDVTSSVTSSNNFRYWLWHSTANATTFTDYKIRVLISKVGSKSVIYGDPYGTLLSPIKYGYIFDGWYTALNGGTQVTSSTSVANLNDHTLYAHWTYNMSTITFNCNGGSGSNVTRKYENGTNAAVQAQNCGYKITTGTSGSVKYQTGWATTSGGSATATITVSSDTTIYATWDNLFTYAGSYNVLNDGSGNWRVKFLTAGAKNLVMAKSTAVDVFAVGGGGAGGSSGTSSGNSNYTGGGGGGGGRVNTCSNITASGTVSITVGAGGTGTTNAAGGNGSASKFGTLCTANGGTGGGYGGATRLKGGAGGAGGSGGGGGASGYYMNSGAGGTNGGDGAGNTSTSENTLGAPGTGSGTGTNTREFGESSGTIYSGGGSGGLGSGSSANSVGTVGSTANGGGAGGATHTAGSAGTANTGGGGGGAGAHTGPGSDVYKAGGNGGSGIVIMRNHRS